MPVRLFFARHLRFLFDRVAFPEFFCWPSMHMVSDKFGDSDFAKSQGIFDRNRPLFMADLDGEVRPALMEGRNEVDVYSTFNEFYGGVVLYDLIGQWTVSEGPFKYDESLTNTGAASQLKIWSDRKFEGMFGIAPDSFR